MKLLFTFLTAFLFTFGAYFLIRALAQPFRLGVQGGRLFSGLILLIGASLALLLFSPDPAKTEALVWVLGAAFLAGLGADYLRLPRLLQILLAGLIAWWAAHLGFLINNLKPPFFSSFIDLGRWSMPVSIVWILAVVYAVILCRRLPGLASGLVGIVSLSFLAVVFIVFQSPVIFAAALACSLAGASWGAFPHDFPSAPFAAKKGLLSRLPPLAEGAPAHWVLGFALALLSVVGLLKNTAFLMLAAPLLLLGVPVVEATYAFVYGGPGRRVSFSLRQRKELLHEAFMRGGLSPRRAIAVFLIFTLYLSALVILLSLMVRVSFLIKLLVLLIFGSGGLVLFYFAARILSRLPKSAGAAEKVDFLEVPVAPINMEGALQKIEAYVQAGTPHMVATSDSTSVIRAHQDAELAAILKQAALVTPDGTGVVWMAKVLGLPIEQRVSGIDLLENICERAAKRGWHIYLLGAEPGVTEAAAQRLQERHLGLQIVGCMHGYFSAEEEPYIISAISSLQPDILFVGFGIPRQEKWIASHLVELKVPVVIGVGGSFDVISGRLQRAPKWMQNAGLEWLYRTLQQPKRLPRLLVLPRLFMMTLREVISRLRPNRPKGRR